MNQITIKNVRDQVSDEKVRNQVFKQVAYQVRSQALNLVWLQVRKQVWNLIHLSKFWEYPVIREFNQVKNKVDRQAESQIFNRK